MNDKENFMMRIATLYRYEPLLPVVYINDLQAVQELCDLYTEKNEEKKVKRDTKT